MEPISTRIPEEHYEELQDRTPEGDPFADTLRETIARGLEYDSLQSEIEELQTEIERLRNEKRQIIEDREEKRELVEYVEREKELEEVKAEAPVWTRARWWVFGRSE